MGLARLPRSGTELGRLWRTLATTNTESGWMAVAECQIETDSFSDKSHLSPHHCQAPHLAQVVMSRLSVQCRPRCSPRPLLPAHRAPPQSRRTRSPCQRPPPRLCPVIQSLATHTVSQSLAMHTVIQSLATHTVSQS